MSPWYPPNSTHVADDGHELYLVGSEATLMTYRGVLQDRGQITDGAIKVAAEHQATSLRVTVGPDEPGAEPALPELSAATEITIVAIIDILAMDRDGFDSRHTPAPVDVEVIEVRTYDQVVEYEKTSALAWGYPPPTSDNIQSAYERLKPGSFAAYNGGTPSGTGGYTRVGDVARFWGAAVVADRRGRGVYRSLVALNVIGRLPPMGVRWNVRWSALGDAPAP
ncbi:MAG: hypothetical protein QOI25_2622 [Mycobacterium sp.]|nr:hypothetical protein [Mycobacterium sp.]